MSASGTRFAIDVPVMRVLLDTHVWIWHLTSNARLSSAHRRILRNPAVDIWLSAISIWEAHLLIENKRLRVNLSPDAWIRQALQALSVHEAPITFRIATLSRQMGLLHNDPADRFIAATSASMEIPLLTADESLIACPGIVCR